MSGLKRFGQSGFFDNAICCEFRFQLAVDRYPNAGSRIPPNLMVAASLSLEFVALSRNKRITSR